MPVLRPRPVPDGQRELGFNPRLIVTLKMAQKLKGLDVFHYFFYFQYTMKTSEKAKSSEIAGVEAVRDLIGQLPSLAIESVEHALEIGPNLEIDGRALFSHGGISYALVIEVKSDGAPRYVRSGVFQLKGYVAHLVQSGRMGSGRRWIPMLVSPYLSPQSRAICKDHGVAYLDLVGNANLAFDSVYIDRAVAEKPRTETRKLRSMFAPKASAILRVMLRNPDRAWRVTALAREANASLGHVSNVRKALLNREWIEKRDAGVVLVQPDALLKTWRESYRRPQGHRVDGFTYLHGEQVGRRLMGELNAHQHRPRAIYSLHSAAQWLAPFGRDTTLTFYADEPGLQRLEETLNLRPVERGANVIARVPVGDTVFDDAAEPTRGVFCTSPVVTYLDLWNGNDRDREAAEHLAKECFPWLS